MPSGEATIRLVFGSRTEQRVGDSSHQRRASQAGHRMRDHAQHLVAIGRLHHSLIAAQSRAKGPLTPVALGEGKICERRTKQSRLEVRAIA